MEPGAGRGRCIHRPATGTLRLRHSESLAAIADPLFLSLVLLPSRRADRSLLASRIFETEVRRNVCIFFMIQFDIRVDEVVQGISVLFGRKNQIAADGELHAIVVPMSEEEFALFGMLPCFGDVDRNPSVVFRIEICPAMVAGNVTFVLVCWNRETNLESRGNALRASHRDEKR